MADKSYYDQAKDTVNDVANRVSSALQPGDSKSTAQPLQSPESRFPQRATTPTTTTAAEGNQPAAAADGGAGENKSLWQSAQETVSKALGGEIGE
ncbi:hypothetical protein T310_1415 [Rasamsonia emersonii CBS 393.64]|uniref:Uncharacterized protein n=1 Tax=Rasamsonia emersonii (strain ATCC 16479 / CBS 393.64 / IMI 116815) TaxID=1408163 RepID=A0A0F4Z1X8_RASE3|nr:hypothetical protein T310_1415 [Rasamsonia emersonii CBS 393.64]KKA24514.1 hypothetical protein T310_1415 [Rasamsonia emersonii CBS 393.64]